MFLKKKTEHVFFQENTTYTIYIMIAIKLKKLVYFESITSFQIGMNYIYNSTSSNKFINLNMQTSESTSFRVHCRDSYLFSFFE